MLEAGEASFEESKEAAVANKKIVLAVVAKRGFLKALSDLNEKNCEGGKTTLTIVNM